MPPPLPRLSRTGNRFPVWLFFLAIPALILLALVYARFRLHSKANVRIEAVKAAGLPTSGAKLNLWLPTIDPAKNGALLITQAFARAYSHPDDRSNLVSTIKILQTNLWTPTFAPSFVSISTPTHRLSRL